MQPLPGFEGTNPHPDKIARVDKKIFGTQDGAIRYFKAVRIHLTAHGYAQAQSDKNLYHKKTSTQAIYIAVTIDDFAVAATHIELYHAFLYVLRLKYKVKDLGEPKRIIGWSIARDPRNGLIHISQPQLTMNFITTMGCKLHALQTPLMRQEQISAQEKQMRNPSTPHSTHLTKR